MSTTQTGQTFWNTQLSSVSKLTSFIWYVYSQSRTKCVQSKGTTAIFVLLKAAREVNFEIWAFANRPRLVTCEHVISAVERFSHLLSRFTKHSCRCHLISHLIHCLHSCSTGLLNCTSHDAMFDRKSPNYLFMSFSSKTLQTNEPQKTEKSLNDRNSLLSALSKFWKKKSKNRHIQNKQQ